MIKPRPYIKSLKFKEDAEINTKEYPYNIPAVAQCANIAFHPDVTFFCGENGSGKSTLLEAIAVAYGFNPEGGTKFGLFEVHNTHSDLHQNIQLVRSFKQPQDGYFLRAETFYNLATKVDEFNTSDSYGGKSLHKQSHGEAFLNTLTHKLRGDGLYILDEPEAALSPTRQLAVLSVIKKLVAKESQFIIATHSPIILAYADAQIYHFSSNGLNQITYMDTEHYRVSRDFLNNPKGSMSKL
jgi:predicted ATPase